MAMEDQIGALAELLKGMQSRMDQQHDSLRRTLEANTSALRDLCGKSPATSAATASILASSSDECETEVANSTTASSSRAVASSSAPLAPSPTPTSFQEATLTTNIVPTVPIVNRDDCVREVVVTTNDGKSPTTSATPSASSPPGATPQDVDWAVLVVSSDHAEVTHPNCSTPGLRQVATILVPVTAFSVASMCTSTSMPPLDVSIANPTAATELVLMEHTRCSTLGLYRSYVPVMAITSSATASDQDAKIDISAAEHQQVQHEGRLLSACSLGTPNQRLVTSLMFKAINTSLTSSIAVHQLCLNTNAEQLLPKPPWVSLVCIKITSCLVSSSNVGILTVECLGSKTKLVLEMEKNRKLLQYRIVTSFLDLWSLLKCSQDCCVLLNHPCLPPALFQDMPLTAASIYGSFLLASHERSSEIRILMPPSNVDYISWWLGGGVYSHQEDNWKWNLLVESLSYAQVDIFVLIAGDQCKSSRPSFSCYQAKPGIDVLSYIEMGTYSIYHKFLIAMKLLYFNLIVQQGEVVYDLIWRVMNTFNCCKIYSLRLNWVCFSKIQQGAGIHWEKSQSKLHNEGGKLEL